MGSWGYNWWQNDDYFDMVAACIKPMRKEIDAVNRLKSYPAKRRHYASARAASMILVQLGTLASDEDLAAARDALATIAVDRKWHTSFKDPDKHHRTVETEFHVILHELRRRGETK